MSSRLPLIHLQRGMAAQAAVAKSAVGATGGVKVTTLPNGLTVASLDNGSPVASLGLGIKAGSRNETYDNLGISHAMKIASGLSSNQFTSFAIARNLAQLGSGLQCQQGRETTLYSAQVLRNNVDDAIDYFLSAVDGQQFRPWEVNDNTNRLKIELEDLSDQEKVKEMLHKAAFREGLGNSIYTQEHMIGKHKPAMMKGFFNAHFTTHRTVLIGLGVSHDVLTKYASLIKMEGGKGPENKSKYYGGELRRDSPGKLAHVSIAGPVPGWTADIKAATAARVLQFILGAGSHVKYNQGAGKIQKAVGEDAKACTEFYEYTDAGLLSANITVAGNKAGKAVEAVAAALRSINVTNEELAAAKNHLVGFGSDCFENPAINMEIVADMALYKDGGSIGTVQYIDMVKSITLGEVQAIAKQLSSSKLTMASTGNLSTVPYLDSL